MFGLPVVLEVFLHSHSSVTHSLIDYRNLTFYHDQLILIWGRAFGLLNRSGLVTHASVCYFSGWHTTLSRNMVHSLRSSDIPRWLSYHKLVTQILNIGVRDESLPSIILAEIRRNKRVSSWITHIVFSLSRLHSNVFQMWVLDCVVIWKLDTEIILIQIDGAVIPDCFIDSLCTIINICCCRIMTHERFHIRATYVISTHHWSIAAIIRPGKIFVVWLLVSAGHDVTEVCIFA